VQQRGQGPGVKTWGLGGPVGPTCSPQCSEGCTSYISSVSIPAGPQGGTGKEAASFLSLDSSGLGISMCGSLSGQSHSILTIVRHGTLSSDLDVTDQ
jgi:hypothetical protein